MAPTHSSPKNLERAYRTFVRCREIVHQATSETAFYSDLCETAVSELGYRLAWIGLVSKDRVLPAAQAGFEDGYLSSIVITWTDDATGQGPTGRAVRSHLPAVSQDIANDPQFEPWREDALRRGYASSVAIPLCDGTSCLGTFNLYAAEPDAFDEEEIALLEDMAIDLVLGIRLLRMQDRIDLLSAHLDRVLRVEAAAAATTALAHDINNLMQVVLAAISLSASTDDPEVRAEALRDAENATRSLAKLSRQLMALTRRTTHHDVYSRVDPVIRSAGPLLARLASTAKLEFELADDGERARVAPIDLERMLINLVVNAAQAMPAGGRILVSTEILQAEAPTPTASRNLPAGRYLHLRVVDEGQGISAEVLPHVFEPFFTTKSDEGTGLGLPAVLSLADNAGGGVAVQSTEGAGTTVSVYLPLYRGTPDVAPL